MIQLTFNYVEYTVFELNQELFINKPPLAASTSISISLGENERDVSTSTRKGKKKILVLGLCRYELNPGERGVS